MTDHFFSIFSWCWLSRSLTVSWWWKIRMPCYCGFRKCAMKCSKLSEKIGDSKLWLKQASVDSNWTHFLPKADLMLCMNHIKTSKGGVMKLYTSDCDR